MIVLSGDWSSGLSGFIGSLIGAGATIAGFYVKDRLEKLEQRKLDKLRKKYLKQMLDNPGPDGWRKFEALSRVIGADRAETTRLLIELGARGSENGNDVWALSSKKPLP